MAETIDDIAKNAPHQEQKTKEKKQSVTQSALEEIVSGIGTGANLAAAGAVPWIADRGIGNFNGMGGFGATATSGALYAGADDKSSKSARNESIVGTLFAAFAKYTLGPISGLGAYAKAALIPLWQAAANAYYLTADHLVKNKKFSGLAKRFKEGYTKMTTKAIAFLSIPTYLTTFLPGIWQVPSIALQSYIFRKYIAPDKKEPKAEKDKTPYLVATSNVISKLGNRLIYSPLKALYEIGSGYAYSPALQPKPA